MTPSTDALLYDVYILKHKCFHLSGAGTCLVFLVLNGAISSRMELQMILKLVRCSYIYNKGSISQGIVLKALLKILAEVELKNSRP